MTLTAVLLSGALAGKSANSLSYDTLALGRINSFMLATELIDPASQTCGITKASIERAIEYPLVGTGLMIGKSERVLDVSVASIIILTNVCATTYELGMTVRLPVVFRGQSSSERVLLWSAEGIFSTPLPATRPTSMKS